MSFLEKVSQINNDPSIYGTFAEIGAGQEVAHAFFQVGHASSTIAKTMSAYDMKFSDAIYGEDTSYVCRQRLLKMLAKEYDLIGSRLKDRANKTRFFVFADTVATGSQRRKIPGHGWLGVRFQHRPEAEISQVIVHVTFLPRSPLQQHRIVGEIGVSLLYACFYHHDCVYDFISSLTVDLDSESIEVDYIEFSGKVFPNLDHRLISLELVKRKLTGSVIFDENGQPRPPSVHLHKKHIIASQGSFRPLTQSKWTMMDQGRKRHSERHGLQPDEVVQVAGISRVSLFSEGFVEADFHLRVDMLAAMNVCVLVADFSSDFSFIQKLNKYSTFSKALVVGSHSLVKVLDESHYAHLTGGLLEALGMMVSHNTTFYISPVKLPNQDLLRSEDVFLCQNKKMLLHYMKSTGLCYELLPDSKSADQQEYHSSDMVRMMMVKGEDWQGLVPRKIQAMLEKKLRIWKSME